MGTDEYERRYLGGAEAFYREKRVSRRTFALMAVVTSLLSVLALGALAVGLFGGEVQGFGGAALFGLLAALMGVLGIGTAVARTTVAPDALRFMVGLRHVTVPLVAITDTALGVLDPATLRRDVAADGAALASVFDARDRYVRVAWRDPQSGKPRVAWLGSDTPEALRAAIDRARASGAGPARRVVLEASAEPESQPEITDDRSARHARR